MAGEYKKPLPVPSEDSGPFWEACRRHELCLQRCEACGRFRFPPAILCPECHSLAFQWAPVSGRGKVWSFVVFHRAYHPGFAEELPYTVAWIELEEGARVISNVVGCRPDEVRCDMSVEVGFEDVTPEVTLPKFRPRG
ncbi:MAG: OB-fold domain-containing protein [Deltaproteobacteria bacterium]|nr:OB-fold domain-containing protein [Deltaproteobacteria bacterium]